MSQSISGNFPRIFGNFLSIFHASKTFSRFFGNCFCIENNFGKLLNFSFLSGRAHLPKSSAAPRTSLFRRALPSPRPGSACSTPAQLAHLTARSPPAQLRVHPAALAHRGPTGTADRPPCPWRTRQRRRRRLGLLGVRAKECSAPAPIKRRSRAALTTPASRSPPCMRCAPPKLCAPPSPKPSAATDRCCCPSPSRAGRRRHEVRDAEPRPTSPRPSLEVHRSAATAWC